MQVTINGVEVDGDNPKALAKAIKAAKKTEEAAARVESADREQAGFKAREKAYYLLWGKAKGNNLPSYTLSRPGDRSASYLFEHRIHHSYTDASSVKILTTPSIDMYVNANSEFIGVACGAACIPILYFVRDKSEDTTTCWAIGTHGGSYALAECPGIMPDDFEHDEPARATGTEG